MSDVRRDLLETARVAAGLLRAPEAAAAWDRPSALREFGVAGLAGHTAYNILLVPEVLDSPRPAEPVVPLLGHYVRIDWVGSGPDDEVNRRIRRTGDEVAAGGPEDLADRADEAVRDLAARLPAAQERPVRLPFWGPWSLGLEDFLITRMRELAVHSDDLAVSVHVATPALPEGAVDAVVDLLSRLSVRRHGPTAVLRAFSRAERAPDTFAAF
ncbi:maleylpyruvate isomerase N-terminal domain-containing protein [Streptomyces sp. WMMC500]|uniref:maleylpyruvate isomerase N-terminal domain-containing protein n=1 Tax=Streptomyces sp. WMMC500 TaxID=3015154 RepID=UPI00248B45A4|nr:maleylpyruvate isomerase N-terminal domain-containing protein [Streptomyces sp. WMMC500]WBB60910.1 maleylpyruvate isomerase N-terminal domain-containing protein [Streptomyces sp. WMMC500]